MLFYELRFEKHLIGKVKSHPTFLELPTYCINTETIFVLFINKYILIYVFSYHGARTGTVSWDSTIFA